MRRLMQQARKEVPRVDMNDLSLRQGWYRKVSARFHAAAQGLGIWIENGDLAVRAPAPRITAPVRAPG